MGQEDDRCTICGFNVVPVSSKDVKPDLWQSEFRIVYSDQDITALSGVGLLRYSPRSGWPVPPISTRHWSDADEDRGEDMVILGLTGIREVSPYYGFAFHEACWKLLQKRFQPLDVPLQRFHDVCNSMTKLVHFDSVNWGHDYLGLAYLDEIYHYPYEQVWKHSELPTTGRQMVASNPHHVADIAPLLATAKPPSSDRSSDNSITISNRDSKADCFSLMPWEIRLHFACLLPTKDALSLRLVSPAFLDIFSCPQFWKSRFEYCGELEFLFEARDRAADQDWRGCFREYQRLKGLPGPMNRLRVWKLCAIVRAHLLLRTGCVQHDPVADSRRISWKRAAACTKSSWWAQGGDVHTGSRLRTETIISVPQNLHRVSVSVLHVAAVTYVVGLKLFSAITACDKSDVGYTIGGEESFYDTQTLQGFELAIRAAGICALRVLGKNGDKSKWFGDPEGSPLTRRLQLHKPVQAIKAELDGYKITGLSVTESMASQDTSFTARKTSFRDAMLWYPEVPDAELFLNEESAFISLPPNQQYQPMNWICFGGREGALLPRLTKMSVFAYSYMSNIEFHYDDNGKDDGICDEKRSWMKLGRTYGNGMPRDYFQIDGAGGELITSVGVSHQEFESSGYALHLGRLTYMSITTNRNRSCSFGQYNAKTPIRQIEVAPGTSIVGFYGFCTEAGICDLGVISIKLPSSMKIGSAE